MGNKTKRVYFKDGHMTRSLDEPVTMPDYGFLLAILEMKIDRIIADQRKLIQILEVREDVES